MSRLAIVVSVALAWGSAFYGALAIAQLDLGHWDSLCGPWGCLPPSGPVLSVHLMWLALIGGLGWLARLAIPQVRDWRPWLGFLILSLLVTFGLTGYAFAEYTSQGGAADEWLRFSCYKLVTWTDYPLMQLIAVSAGNFLLARTKKSQLKNTVFAETTEASQRNNSSACAPVMPTSTPSP